VLRGNCGKIRKGTGIMGMDFSFYKGKNVLVTGHTGFKGSWLCTMLVQAGAKVTGYALEPLEDCNLFNLSKAEKKITSVIGNIKDFEGLYKTFEMAEPDIVFHLAAQPLVQEAYQDPRDTYETNVMGTVNVCECIRKSSTVKSFINITTDKVYRNREWEWGYRENDVLDGYDPYSNSKSCSELVTGSYVRSYLSSRGIAVSTLRAGNVIGGGDFAANRILPDCIRAASKGQIIKVRNPESVRPYQHVLEALNAYMMVAQRQYDDRNYAGSYNIGPDDSACISTGELTEIFCREWGSGASWECKRTEEPHEAKLLKLDCSKLKAKFGWRPLWDIERAVRETVAWTKAYLAGDDMKIFMEGQIQDYWDECG